MIGRNGATPERQTPQVPGFEVTRHIGGGGMGDVWEAKQLSLGRRVAIKALATHLTATPHFVSRFENEAKAMARLQHPNIVAVYDFHTSSGGCFLVMEHVEGSSGTPIELKDLISTGKLDSQIIRKLVLQIADALGFAHEKGIIHRDVKPSNVLVDRQGNAKVADFGIAALLDVGERRRLTIDNSVMGTPAYMSPEQKTNAKQVDARSDVFSLGVMIYELLTGRLPEGRFAPASQCVPGLHPAWDSIIDQALQPDPAQRFSSMLDLAEAIRGVPLEDSPAAATAGPDVGRPSTVSLPENTCFQCRAAVPPESQHCPHCGASLKTSCPRCKAESLGGAKFCPGCGTDIAKARQFEEYFLRGQERLGIAEDGSRLLSDRLNQLQQSNIAFARAAKHLSPNKEETAVIDRAKKLMAKLAIEAADAAWKEVDYRSVQEYCQIALEIDSLNNAAKQRMRELKRYRDQTTLEVQTLVKECKYDKAKARLDTLRRAFGPEPEFEQFQAEIDTLVGRSKNVLGQIQDLRNEKRLIELRSLMKQLQRDQIPVPGLGPALQTLEGTVHQLEIAFADAKSLADRGLDEQALQIARRILVQVSDFREVTAFVGELSNRAQAKGGGGVSTLVIAAIVLALLGAGAYLTKEHWTPWIEKLTQSTATASGEPEPVGAKETNAEPAPKDSRPKEPSKTNEPQEPGQAKPVQPDVTSQAKTANDSAPGSNSQPMIPPVPDLIAPAARSAESPAKPATTRQIELQFASAVPRGMVVKVDGEQTAFERVNEMYIKLPVKTDATLLTFDITDSNSNARIYTKLNVRKAMEALPALTLVEPGHTQNHKAHENDVGAVCIAEGGQLYFSAQRGRGPTALVGWKMVGEAPRYRSWDLESALPLALSTDSSCCAIWLRERNQRNSFLRVLDVATFRTLRDLKGDDKFVPVHIVFKPRSTDTIGTFDETGRIHCWNLQRPTEVNHLPIKRGQRTAMAASADGKHLLVAVNASPNYIHRYQFESQGPQTPHQYDGATGEIIAVGGSEATGRIVAATGGRYGNTAILTWDFNAKSNPKIFTTNDRAMVAAVTGDGYYALLGAQDGRMALYDVEQQQEVERFDPHLKNMGRVETIAITYDGRFAVSGGSDDMVYRYQLPIVCW